MKIYLKINIYNKHIYSHTNKDIKQTLSNVHFFIKKLI